MNLVIFDFYFHLLCLDPRYYFSERMVCRSKVQAERVVKNEQIGSSTIENLVQRRRLPSPGQGPNEEQRKAAWFQFTTIAESESGKRVAVKLVCTILY